MATTEKEIALRTCTKCHRALPLSDFYSKRAKPHFYAECRECFRQRVHKPQQRWYIKRVKFNHEGYDPDGNYYGIGKPLWYVHNANGDYDFFIRGTRDYARCAYQWARQQRNIYEACRYLTSYGISS